MKHIIAIGLLALACGAAEEQDTPDLDTAGDEIELGTAEEALTVAGPTFGVSTASSKLSCNKTSSGQVCTVPLHHTFKYCYGNGLTTSDISAYEASIANLVSQEIQQSNMFTMQRVFAGNVANCEAASFVNAELKIKGGTCSGSSSSSNVDAYVCLTVGNTAALTESVPGSWSSHASGQITVDKTDIAAYVGADAIAIADHGIRHAVLGYWGIGSNDPSCGGQFCASQRSINPTTWPCGIGVVCTSHTQISNTQQCIISNYSVNSPTTFAFNSFTCP